MAGKVERVMQVFASDPKITLVCSNSEMMNSAGQPLGKNRWCGPLSAGLVSNFITNRFLGCTLAFRPVLREWALPFPPDIPMHDIWLGMVNALFSKGYFINEPLIRYRDHEKSVTFATRTLRGRLAFGNKAKWRYLLFKNLLARYKAIKKQSGKSKPIGVNFP